MERRYLCIFLPKWKESLKAILPPQAEALPNNTARDSCYSSSRSNDPASADPVMFKLRKNREAAEPSSTFAKATADKPAVRDGAVGDEQLPFFYLCKLVPWANKYAPLVGLDRELIEAYRTQTLDKVSPAHYGLILDITGTERLHGSETNLLNKLSRSLSNRKIAHRLTISPSIGSSWAVSRYSKSPLHCIIQKHEITEYLDLLPPAALRINSETLGLFKKLGITQIGQLLGFQTKALATRFGLEVVERIEQALAQRLEAMQCARYKESFKAERNFDLPIVSHKTLQTVITELFKELLEDLNKKQKVAGSFFVELYPQREGGILDGRSLGVGGYSAIKPFVKQFSLFQASNNPEHIFNVIEPWVSTIKANDGIKRINVEAKFTKNSQAQQEDFYAEQKVFSPLPEVINQLVVRLGKNHVARIFFEESYIPEKSFGYSSVMEARPKYSVVPKTTDRPSYLLQKPEQISALALLPDHPPAWISWRGEKLNVSKGLGPERISPEWWLGTELTDSNRETRDYFKLQDQHGRWLWVFRSLPEMQWFIHGVWN